MGLDWWVCGDTVPDYIVFGLAAYEVPMLNTEPGLHYIQEIEERL